MSSVTETITGALDKQGFGVDTPVFFPSTTIVVFEPSPYRFKLHV